MDPNDPLGTERAYQALINGLRKDPIAGPAIQGAKDAWAALPGLGREFGEDPAGTVLGVGTEMARAHFGLPGREPGTQDQTAMDLEFLRQNPEVGAAHGQLGMPIRTVGPGYAPSWFHGGPNKIESPRADQLGRGSGSFTGGGFYGSDDPIAARRWMQDTTGPEGGYLNRFTLDDAAEVFDVPPIGQQEDPEIVKKIIESLRKPGPPVVMHGSPMSRSEVADDFARRMARGNNMGGEKLGAAGVAVADDLGWSAVHLPDVGGARELVLRDLPAYRLLDAEFVPGTTGTPRPWPGTPKPWADLKYVDPDSVPK